MEEAMMLAKGKFWGIISINNINIKVILFIKYEVYKTSLYKNFHLKTLSPPKSTYCRSKKIEQHRRRKS
uniref:Uncharacterized protein n=1 Tax=Manihot esculenta TaxID=3983 RepID=A0A2C9V249_MANES